MGRGIRTGLAVIAGSLGLLACAANAHAVTFDASGPIEVDADYGGLSLRAVDCPAVTLCVAVDSSGQAASWDPGGSADPVRGIISTPNALAAGRPCIASNFLADGSGACAESLTAVACANETTCVATNGDRNTAIAFEPADPAGTAESVGVGQVPGAVDCASASRCAVANLNGEVSVVDPGAGTATSTALTDGGFLVDISCPDPDQCTAIGVTGGVTPDAKITTFNPGDVAGTEQTTTVTDTELSNVDCPSAAQCTVVTGGAAQSDFATFDPSPAPALTFHDLDGTAVRDIDCPAVNICTLTVGGQGSAWNPQSTNGAQAFLPLSLNNAPVYAVSCIAVDDCVAVDAEGRAHRYSASPLAGQGSRLVDAGVAMLGVSCVSASLCSATGYLGVGDTSSTAYATTFAPSDPAAGQDLALSEFGLAWVDISCASGLCVLADRLARATRWQPPDGAPTTALINVDSFLPLAIDCVATTSPPGPQCSTVNEFGGATDFDAFAPDQGTSRPAGAQDGYGVSCPAADLCVRVDQNGGISKWDPATTDDATGALLQPAGLVGQALAVSCPTTSECTAVTRRGMVIDVSLPDLATVTNVDTDQGLSAVDCPTAEFCVVGDDEGGFSVWEHSGTPARVQLEGAANILSIDCPTDDLCVAVDGVGQAFALDRVPDPPDPPANVALPTVAGTPVQGQQLSVVNGTWTGDPTSFAHRWLRCDAAGDNCTQVAGDQTTYSLTAADEGFTIRVEETATGPGGPSQPALSAQTAVVAALPVPPPPVATPTASVGPATGSAAGVSVPVTCSGSSGACPVALVVRGRKVVKGGKLAAVKPPVGKGRRVTLGSGGGTVSAGRTETVSIPLNPSALRFLAKLGKIRVQVEVVCGASAPPQRVTIRGGAKSPGKPKKRKRGAPKPLPGCG